MSKRNLNVLNFGLAWGIVFAIYIFLIGIFASAFDLWDSTVEIISSWYPGFNATFFGSLIGSFWGFIDGLIMGALVAWIYNN
jgi:hypothetical protein